MRDEEIQEFCESVVVSDSLVCLLTGAKADCGRREKCEVENEIWRVPQVSPVIGQEERTHSIRTVKYLRQRQILSFKQLIQSILGICHIEDILLDMIPSITLRN